MFLSFIVPVYNVEKYLPECLDSLLDQDISHEEYEIICVNDGSTDGSLEILRQYEGKYANIRVIDKENGGVASARNAGFDAAQGEFFWFVDSVEEALQETERYAAMGGNAYAPKTDDFRSLMEAVSAK